MAKRHSIRTDALESIITRLEELVLANSGENEFDEVFKLLIAKLYDERFSGKPRFRRASSDSQTFEVISDLLAKAEHRWPGILGAEYQPKLQPAHLSVCVESLEGQNLSKFGLNILDNFFEFLVSKNAKGAKGQYFTPRYVSDFCVRVLNPKPGESVVDPACGSGVFLFQTLQWQLRSGSIEPSQIPAYSEKHLWGFDIDARAVRVAKALMLLAGDGQSNIFQLNSLLKPLSRTEQTLLPIPDGGEPLFTIEDVVRTKMKRAKGFDVLITNPPFAGEVREPRLLDQYWAARGKTRIERDILFIERCVELLKPGGRMAIVLPYNKVSAETWGEFRKWLSQSLRFVGVVSLGRHTFLPHTHQKAVVLVGRKRRTGEKPAPSERIFFAISERDGKNPKGQLLLRPTPSTDSLWDQVDHDLDVIEADFSKFVKTEKIFE